jgi:hypothetical protein
MVPARNMNAFVTQVGIKQKQHVRQALIATARSEEARVIREQRARAGYVPTLTRIVDGKRGAPYESVSENGLIILQWGYLREIAAVMMDRLRARSPQDQGDYKRGLKLFVGGSETDTVPPNAQNLTAVATVPYARKLEVGTRKGGGPFVLQVQPHIVQETAKLLAKDYKGVATIRFDYAEFEGLQYRRATRDSSTRRARRERDTALRYPAIKVVDPR